MVGPQPGLSIVSTLYRSEPFVDEFCRRMIAAAEAITRDFEIILVNDGSPDGSYQRALEWHARDPRIIVIDLSRNFGHHKAMMTGLGWARGDFVFLVDSDLEEEPELLGCFWAHMHDTDCDVTYGYQAARRGTLFQRLTGDFFFYMANRLTDLPLPRNIVTARLMTRRYVQALVRHRDHDFMIGNLWALTGFNQVGIPVEKKTTKSAGYSVHKRVDMALSFLTAHSTKIVYVFLYLGLSIAICAAANVVYLVVRYVLWGTLAEGWTSVMVSIWFFGGLTIFLLGLLGVYASKILIETKRRPYTVVREVVGAPQSPSRLEEGP